MVLEVRLLESGMIRSLSALCGFHMLSVRIERGPRHMESIEHTAETATYKETIGMTQLTLASTLYRSTMTKSYRHDSEL